MYKYKGFTLVELMISLTLGLLLVAIAVQILISGQINYRIQQAASTIQDSGVFSLNAVTKNIRLANHGNSDNINDETLYGGIVLSLQNPLNVTPARQGNLSNLKIGSALITNTTGMSQNQYQTSGFGSTKSDQLVIVYQAPFDMTTCTGRSAKGPYRTLDRTAGTITAHKGWMVVERYYIKQNTTTGSADLYCSDAMFLAAGETVTGSWTATQVVDQDYTSLAGQMIAPNVDFMRIQLVVKKSSNTHATMSISEYQNYVAGATKRPAIIGLNLGWLVRSSEKVDALGSKTYTVLDTALTAPNDKYMRHIYTTSIALRNGGLGVMQ